MYDLLFNNTIEDAPFKPAARAMRPRWLARNYENILHGTGQFQIFVPAVYGRKLK